MRTDLGLNQEAMAKRVGLGAASWKRLELEGRAPKADVLAQLVEMGFSADWLLTGVGSMRRDSTPEAAGTPDQQQADTPVDIAVLEETTEVIEVLLAEFRRVMDAKTKAKVIARIYAYLATENEEAEAKRTAEVIRLFRDAS